MRTAIIGGGIAGLAAAYELEQARQKGAQVEYTLFEERAQLGIRAVARIPGYKNRTWGTQFWVMGPYGTCTTRPAAMGDSGSSTGRIDPRNYQLYVQKNAYFIKDSQG